MSKTFIMWHDTNFTPRQDSNLVSLPTTLLVFYLFFFIQSLIECRSEIALALEFTEIGGQQERTLAVRLSMIRVRSHTCGTCIVSRFVAPSSPFPPMMPFPPPCPTIIERFERIKRVPVHKFLASCTWLSCMPLYI